LPVKPAAEAAGYFQSSRCDEKAGDRFAAKLCITEFRSQFFVTFASGKKNIRLEGGTPPENVRDKVAAFHHGDWILIR
jgi:hypothetical protein